MPVSIDVIIPQNLPNDPYIFRCLRVKTPHNVDDLYSDVVTTENAPQLVHQIILVIVKRVSSLTREPVPVFLSTVIVSSETGT